MHPIYFIRTDISINSLSLHAISFPPLLIATHLQAQEGVSRLATTSKVLQLVVRILSSPPPAKAEFDDNNDSSSDGITTNTSLHGTNLSLPRSSLSFSFSVSSFSLPLFVFPNISLDLALFISPLFVGPPLF